MTELEKPDVPDNSLVGGVSARLIREIDNDIDD